MSDAPADERGPSTPPREVLAGVGAAWIAFGCLLIPVVHFVAGPLGPAIGAFIMAGWLRCGPRGVAVLAITEGAVLSGIVYGALRVVVHFSTGEDGPPEWVTEWTSPARLLLVVGGTWAWATLLGALGAGLGAGASNRASRS